MANADTKVALVTGGAQRIGAQLCRTLHEAGYHIALHYRGSIKAAGALSGELNGLRHGSVTCFYASLGDRNAAEELAAEVIEQYGRVDLLVNNASTFYPTPIGSVSEEDWDTIIGSNLKGPFFLCQALADTLRQNRGNIINMIDIHGERPLADHSLYSTAKAGLAMLTRSLARELAPDVRVNGISPGVICGLRVTTPRTPSGGSANSSVCRSDPRGILRTSPKLFCSWRNEPRTSPGRSSR